MTGLKLYKRDKNINGYTPFYAKVNSPKDVHHISERVDYGNWAGPISGINFKQIILPTGDVIKPADKLKRGFSAIGQSDKPYIMLRSNDYGPEYKLLRIKHSPDEFVKKMSKDIQKMYHTQLQDGMYNTESKADMDMFNILMNESYLLPVEYDSNDLITFDDVKSGMYDPWRDSETEVQLKGLTPKEPVNFNDYVSDVNLDGKDISLLSKIYDKGLPEYKKLMFSHNPAEARDTVFGPMIDEFLGDDKRLRKYALNNISSFKDSSFDPRFKYIDWDKIVKDNVVASDGRLKNVAFCIGTPIRKLNKNVIGAIR